MLPDTSIEPNSLIQLGQVIINPLKPTEPVAGTPQPYTETDKPRNTEPWGPLTYVGSEIAENHAGIMARFLQVLTLGAYCARGKSCQHSYEIKSLVRQIFKPGGAYLEKVKKLREINIAFRNKESLYMVTELLVAHGGEVSHTIGTDRKTGLMMVAGGQIGPPGLSIELGGEVGRDAVQKGSYSLSQPNDFIFAYRIQEYRDGILTAAPYESNLAQLYESTAKANVEETVITEVKGSFLGEYASTRSMKVPKSALKEVDDILTPGSREQTRYRCVMLGLLQKET